jgi:hypothetical protein
MLGVRYWTFNQQPVRLAGADGWCWFVLREEYCWLVAGGWFVVREKYYWLVADKPNEQGANVLMSIINKRYLSTPPTVTLSKSFHTSYLRATPVEACKLRPLKLVWRSNCKK